MDNYEKIKELIAENLDIDENEIKPESDLVEDLKADSLDIVELTMAIEDEYDVTIDDDLLENIKTVEDILTALEEALK